MIKDRQLYLYILLFFMAVEVILAFSAFGYIVIEPISISFIKRAVKPLPSGGGYKAPLAWQVCL